MRLQAKMKEREELHTLSKDSVKHWENTIEVGFFIFLFYHVSFLLVSCVLLVTKYRPSDRVQKKKENYAEIFSQIMQKKVSIMLLNLRLLLHRFTP